MKTIYDDLLASIEIPRFVKVRNNRRAKKVENVYWEVWKALENISAEEKIKPGMQVCIAVGSREISNFPDIVRAAVNFVKKCGAMPFLIPAMGSHGGATAQGQRAILKGYGITEESIKAEIRASMETEIIGVTEDGIPVHIDAYANAADLIIPIGRIKPHTDFRGKVESGLCKMLVIGLGKQQGAFICHRYGFGRMAENIWNISKEIVKQKKNIIGIGVIENCFHETYMVKALYGEQFHEEEPELLTIARAQLARLPFAKADVLVLDEIGKEISGAGMDTNVTGRCFNLETPEPFFQSIAVFDVTEKSHGNCSGLGAADVITEKLFRKFSFEDTYPNMITVGDGLGAKIPVVMPNEKLALKFALRCVHDFADETEQIRIIWLKNTLALDEFYISEALVEDAKKIEQIDIISEPHYIEFDEEGGAYSRITNAGMGGLFGRL